MAADKASDPGVKSKINSGDGDSQSGTDSDDFDGPPMPSMGLQRRPSMISPPIGN